MRAWHMGVLAPLGEIKKNQICLRFVSIFARQGTRFPAHTPRQAAALQCGCQIIICPSCFQSCASCLKTWRLGVRGWVADVPISLRQILEDKKDKQD
jgi:hypothetical protein